MNEIDIAAWVEAAPDGQRGFREAVHIVLDSIGHSRNLQAKMVMKGGLLLAIRYASTRYTRDLDFSTSDRYTAEDADKLLVELQGSLVAAEDRLPYNTACRLQSHKVEPKGEDKSHHNLSLKIGYADKSNKGAMSRLLAKNCPHVVEIDHSFNEAVFQVELLELDGGATIHSYSLHNVLAEKMRSLLQQPIRRRNRRQDVYDIGLLLDSAGPLSSSDLAQIQQMLVDSCRSKGIEPTEESMHDERVVEMARTQALYRSLPWG